MPLIGTPYVIGRLALDRAGHLQRLPCSQRIAASSRIAETFQSPRFLLHRQFGGSSTPDAGRDGVRAPSLIRRLRLTAAQSQTIITDRLWPLVDKLAGKLNEVSGYHDVEHLKSVVTTCEHRLKEAKIAAKTAQSDYDEAVNARAITQRNVNSLLERKHAWTDDDVVLFTSLVRTDHVSNQNVQKSQDRSKLAEHEVDVAFTSLTQAILHRYHEEQVWSDKIRSLATYANLLGLLVNLCIFVGAVAVIEPWKRKRLVEGLEERLVGMNSRVLHTISELQASLHERGQVSATPSHATGPVFPVEEHDLQVIEAAAEVSPLVKMTHMIEILHLTDRPALITGAAVGAIIATGLMAWLR